MSIHSVSSLISYLMAFSSWRLVGLSKNYGLTAQQLSWYSWHRERATDHTCYMHYVTWWKILRRGSAHSWAAHSWAAAKYQNTQRLPMQFCLYLHRSPTAEVNGDVLRKQENQWHSHTSGVRGIRTPCQENTFELICHDVFRLYGRHGRAAEREWTERNATDWLTRRKFLATPLRKTFSRYFCRPWQTQHLVSGRA